MRKKIGTIIMVIGIVLIGISAINLWSSHKQISSAIDTAKEVLEVQTEPVRLNKSHELQKKQESEQTTEQDQIELEPIHYEKGEVIGLLSIPKLEREIAIIEGTDPEELRQGVGHYSGTAFPLEGEQIVLSGHRDTVFTQFDRLELGDVFSVDLSYGTFEYEIKETKIVDADDRTIIVPMEEEVLTVTTCYPFVYVGDAPQRYIIYAYPVEQNEF